MDLNTHYQSAQERRPLALIAIRCRSAAPPRLAYLRAKIVLIVTAKVSYESGLETKAVHLRSGTEIQTDAPVDNGGTGSKFSPTDLVASALASCMLTIMALTAKKHGFALGRVECEVEKIMASTPRRISQIRISMKLFGPNQYSDRERALLERAAITCPVFESLHPDMEKPVQFIWPL